MSRIDKTFESNRPINLKFQNLKIMYFSYKKARRFGQKPVEHRNLFKE